LEKILFVAAGGSIGAVSRYLISLLADKLFTDRFPIGALFVNLSGCFLINSIFSLASEKNMINPSFRLFFVTGFLGALTTLCEADRP